MTTDLPLAIYLPPPDQQPLFSLIFHSLLDIYYRWVPQICKECHTQI